MNNIMDKVFKEICLYDDDFIKRTKQVDNAILEKLSTYNPKETNIDELKDMLFSVSLTAEQVGFEYGAYFATKLLLELYEN